MEGAYERDYRAIFMMICKDIVTMAPLKREHSLLQDGSVHAKFLIIRIKMSR